MFTDGLRTHSAALAQGAPLLITTQDSMDLKEPHVDRWHPVADRSGCCRFYVSRHLGHLYA